MNLFTFAVWLVGACVVFLGAEAQLITPGNTLRYSKIIAGTINVNVNLNRAATDVEIAGVGVTLFSASYAYNKYTRNLDGLHNGFTVVIDAIQPLIDDITTLTVDVNQQDIPPSDLDDLIIHLNKLAKAIAQFCSYAEALIFADAQQTPGTKTVDDITADVNALAAKLVELIAAIGALKNEDFSLFHVFFCGAVTSSAICLGLKHGATACEFLASIITAKVPDLAATDPDAVPKLQNLATALNNLATKLRGVCAALTEHCLLPF